MHTLPGASSDVLARAVSKGHGRPAGPDFVVENRSGAGGAIGVDAVAKAAPDGYTLLAGASSTAMVMLPIVLTRKLPYDENKDFAPIGVISRSPFLLVASQASGIRDLPDLIAKAKGASRQDHLRQRRTRRQSRTCWANCSASWPASS